jgi:hypothetical protein
MRSPRASGSSPKSVIVKQIGKPDARSGELANLPRFAMMRSQILSSGLTIRQDFSEAVRAVFFQTEYEEFLYATDGGTLFVVRFRGCSYGLTCGHVFQTFDHSDLFITQEKTGQKGSKPAPIKGICYPSSPKDGAAETDITDICVIEFADDIASNFFKGGEYIIDEKTVSTSRTGHSLRVAGALKDKSSIAHPDITIGYCSLEFKDAGASSFDPTLRQAKAEFVNPEFDSITGISGSPVFDETANALCGMVVRGGMTGGKCTIYYIDIFDIIRLLEAISERAENTYYTKIVSQPIREG